MTHPSKKRKYITAIETTPYTTRKGDGGFYVYQLWWHKDVAGPYPTEAEADTQLEIIARQAGCWKRVRFAK